MAKIKQYWAKIVDKMKILCCRHNYVNYSHYDCCAKCQKERWFV